MTKVFAIALSFSAILASGAVAEESTNRNTGPTVQIDGFASEGGLGTTRFSGDGGLGTTR